MSIHNDIDTFKQQQIALELRCAGKSYAEISSAMKVTIKRVQELVIGAMHFALEEPVHELRNLAVERCDRMLASLWPRVQNGDIKSIELALKVEERRARLLGLDSPTQVHLRGNQPVRFTIQMGKPPPPKSMSNGPMQLLAPVGTDEANGTADVTERGYDGIVDDDSTDDI